jgi:transcriptional regulator GlxA family with amidase domain
VDAQTPKETTIGLAPERLQRVLAIIDERLAEPVQVAQLAAAVDLSPFHFARMFKQATGKPPHAYITERRMERARDLLRASDLRLCEVATRVGYQTQAHFTGVFHRQVGVTPRVYRVAGAGPMHAALLPIGARAGAPEGGEARLRTAAEGTAPA